MIALNTLSSSHKWKEELEKYDQKLSNSYKMSFELLPIYQDFSLTSKEIKKLKLELAQLQKKELLAKDNKERKRLRNKIKKVIKNINKEFDYVLL